MNAAPELNDCDGDVERWIEASERAFLEMMTMPGLTLNNRRILIRRDRIYDMNRTFWHVMTSGKEDAGRTIMPNRVRGMPRIKEVVDAHNRGDPLYPQYTARKNERDRLHLLSPEAEFLVVLEPSKDAFTLVTAYEVEHERSRRRHLECTKK